MDFSHSGDVFEPSIDSEFFGNAHQKFMLGFFEENRGSSGFLPKTMVDPFHLKAILPFLLLLERTAEDDWRFTVVGTAVAQMYDKDFTGSLLSSLPYPACQKVYERMVHTIADQRRPTACFGMLRYPSRDFLHTVKSGYPISANGESITHCLLLLSVVDKTDSLQNIYSPHGPTMGHDKLFVLDPNQDNQPNWDFRSAEEILYQPV